MTKIVDNMVNLIKKISNVQSNDCIQYEIPFHNNNFQIQSFEISNVIPYMDSVRKLTHICSSDDDSNTFSDEINKSFSTNVIENKESEDFYTKVHSILNQHGDYVKNVGNKYKNKKKDDSIIMKDDLVDIFDDSYLKEPLKYNKSEKWRCQSQTNIPKHLIPVYDNRTIVDCDKKQLNSSYYTINRLYNKQNYNFVQIPKIQNFLWKDNIKNNSNNHDIKTQHIHNILIYDIPSKRCFSTNCSLSKTIQIFSRDAKIIYTKEQKQQQAIKKVPKDKQKSKNAKKENVFSHQNISKAKNSHQIQNNSKNDQKKNHKNKGNQVNKKLQRVKKNKQSDPICSTLDHSSEDEHDSSTKINIKKENNDNAQLLAYKNVKNIQINMKHKIFSEIDPILNNLSSDDNKSQKENQINLTSTKYDPIIENDSNQGYYDKKVFFHCNNKKKQFDELCSFNVSEVHDKIFHINRNKVFTNPNEFSIDDITSDDF